MGRPHVTPTNAGHAYDDGTRRTEILQTAASLIASSGLRTSLQEIADAAGILPGSLYHHFESKEAILVELLRRYHTDLDRIAETCLGHAGRSLLAVRLRPDRRPQRCDRTVRGDARRSTADDVLRGHGPNRELTALAQQRPTAIMEAMVQTLRAARWSGYLKPDVDLPVLADRMVQVMLQVGLDVIRYNASADKLAELLCRILLQGLAAVRPPMHTSTGPRHSSRPTRS